MRVRAPNVPNKNIAAIDLLAIIRSPIEAPGEREERDQDKLLQCAEDAVSGLPAILTLDIRYLRGGPSTMRTHRGSFPMLIQG